MLLLTSVVWKLLACQNGASPDCVIAVVVGCVFWHGQILFKESLLLERLTFAQKKTVQFSFVICVFFDTSNKTCYFSVEKRWHTQNGLLVFFGRKTHS